MCAGPPSPGRADNKVKSGACLGPPVTRARPVPRRGPRPAWPLAGPWPASVTRTTGKLLNVVAEEAISGPVVSARAVLLSGRAFWPTASMRAPASQLADPSLVQLGPASGCAKLSQTKPKLGAYVKLTCLCLTISKGPLEFGARVAEQVGGIGSRKLQITTTATSEMGALYPHLTCSFGRPSSSGRLSAPEHARELALGADRRAGSILERAAQMSQMGSGARPAPGSVR